LAKVLRKGGGTNESFGYQWFPEDEASSTWNILQPLLAGMEAAGATTDFIHVRKLDLKPCIGCFTCWVRTSGECIHDDAMDEPIKRVEEADLLIYGTPLYHFTMSGIMKTFIDRTLPVFEPWLIPHPTMPGMTGHPRRHPKSRQMMLVSPCGFPEFENFQALTATFRFMAQLEAMTYLGV
jgi:putative NADPH-quinone reductase